MSKGRQSESGREEAASGRFSPVHDPAETSRRDFLIRCCQGASAALVPAGLHGLVFPFAYAPGSPDSSPGGEFHLHPKYRAQLPLEATLRKTQAGLDEFVTEKYHDQVAAILAEWSAGFLGSPQDVRAVEELLPPIFREPHSARSDRGWRGPARPSTSGKTNLPASRLLRETPFSGSCGPRWLLFRRSSPVNSR